ncbi:MAG: DNA repair protein RecN [Chlorobi bacterium]|nr:DNA repair protein RecN [Chlorobiota bacterium]
MLKSFSIKNYALIKDLNISFPVGFSVITGETGAGKSILIGALSLLMGKRADYGVLMDKGKKCVVEGVFRIDDLNLEDFFKKNDLDYEPETILRREIIPSGRSRAFINDTPVNLDTLKAMAVNLVDIHSQHQTLELSKPRFQSDVLDAYLDKPEFIVSYKRVFDHLKKVTERLDQLIAENEKIRRDEDYFRFQYDELVAANPDEEELNRLVEREKFLTHAEEVTRAITQANGLMNENERTVSGLITEVLDALMPVIDYFPRIGELVERLNSAQIELNDIASEISGLGLETDFDRDELEQVTERLNAIYHLQQKHHVSSVKELVALKEEYASKLNGIILNDENIKKLAKEKKQLEKEAYRLAGELTEVRLSGGNKLAEAVTGLLHQLGMKEGVFKVNIEKYDTLTSSGQDKITFLFTANKGGEMKPVSSIASGGELSRLMLAVKSLITRKQLLPTVIFDEIDAGVSGDIAGKVGNIIKKMSLRHQVIAITHLPQIAAKADQHYKVYKETTGETTQTKIARLDDEGRVEEIAGMLSDEKVSKAAVDTAKELLMN